MQGHVVSALKFIGLEEEEIAAFDGGGGEGGDQTLYKPFCESLYKRKLIREQHNRTYSRFTVSQQRTVIE